MPRVTLVLASGPGFPEGSPDHRYELDVGLTPGGQMDVEAWLADPAPWPAQRVWPDQPTRTGDVLYDEDTGWSLRFFLSGEAADAPVHDVLGTPGILRPGEYVAIREPDGVEHSYRIVSVA